MRIFIPFTKLRVETYTACRRAERRVQLWPIENYHYGYAEYWIHRWQHGGRFINVEHDVVPVAEALTEMWHCPEDYCICNYRYPYAGSRIDTSPIGCAKFSAEFIAAHQGIFVHRQYWHEIQYLILNATLNKAHIHEPPAVHLHVQDDWPLDARKTYE